MSFLRSGSWWLLRRASLGSLVTALMLGTVSSVAAQVLHGTVTEVESETPLDGVLLRLLDTAGTLRAVTLSDGEGNFELAASPNDSLKLQVQRLGYRELTTRSFLLSPGDSVRLEVRLRPEAVMLDEVTAIGRPRIRRELAGFVRRRSTGFGRYFGPEDLEGIRNTSTDALLVGLGAQLSAANQLGAIHGYRRPTGTQSSRCTPLVFVDGVEITPENPRSSPDPPAVRVVGVVSPPVPAMSPGASAANRLAP